MNTKGLSDQQKSALTDLLILGMYQDGHIAAAEDARVSLLLASFELPSDYERQQFADASFGRMNKHLGTPEAVRSAVFECASHFKNEAQRRQALDALAELLASDNRVTTQENTFLIMVEGALELRKQK